MTPGPDGARLPPADAGRRLVVDGCAVAAVDPAGTEHARGYLVIEGDRIVAVGEGPAPRDDARETRWVDATGCLATPGLVNTHHHLYQWATRGLAQQATLFEWLRRLYPVWARLDGDTTRAAADAAIAALLSSGCATSTDHHYVFPRDGGDLLGVTVEAAAGLGLRFHPCRGSMDLGASSGGLPPDEITEETEDALTATEEAIDRFHDPSPGAMVRVAVAPCSPFSVTRTLMRETAALARRRGVRLHTHLAETVDEDTYCRDTFGRSPLGYAEDLGWLGDDVWLAHGVHFSDADAARLAGTGTGVAHCPSSNARLGAGIAPVSALLAAGTPVGLGVDGAASNEAGRLAPEMRQALLAARQRGTGGAVTGDARGDAAGGGGGDPAALTARQALALATAGGARCLGRDDELGSLEPGKLADVALWRLDGIDHAGIDDAVAALVLGNTTGVDTLLVGGRTVVASGELLTGSAPAIAATARAASERLVRRGKVIA